MSNQVWYAVGLMSVINVILCVGLIVAKFIVVRRAVRLEMTEAVKAVSKRMDASEIYLTAAEQHTAMQEDWERRRVEEHNRRQKEHVALLQKIMRDEIGKQLKVSEATVVKRVEQVPQETATLVATEAIKVAERKTGDSHHG